MRHYKSLVKFFYVEPQPIESPDVEGVTAVGFFVTLGVLALDLREAALVSFDHVHDHAPAPGRIASIEVSEIELESQSPHVKEAGMAASSTGIYFATGIISFPHEESKPWWRFW